MPRRADATPRTPGYAAAMLEGAIIGAIVGLVMAFMAMQQRRGLLTKVLAALDRGGPTAARAQLDTSAPPTQELKLRDIDKQRQRMACLALIGDVEALVREIEIHRGLLTAVVQVNRVGHLGLALRSQGEQRARTIAALEELAARMESEGGALMGIVKKQTHAIASVGRGLLGQPIPTELWVTANALSKERSVVGLVISQALGEAFAAINRLDRAEPYFVRVRAATQAFERRTGAA